MDITLRMSDHALSARAAAAASIVLLKNTDETLPLLPQEDGAPLPIAVFGIRQLRTPAFTPGAQPWRAVGVLDGLQASELVRPDLLLARKYRTWALEHPDGSELPVSADELASAANACGAAVVVVGREAGQTQLRLREEETALLRRVNAAFSRTVLVLATPGPMELNEDARACGAIVFLGLAGQEAGYALADVLTAQVMPSGHLAHSWPEALASFDEAGAAVDQFVGYRYFDAFGTPVRYAFGHGLHYGRVEFGSVSAGLDGCDVTVSAELINTGERYPASELVQVYVTRPEGDTTLPVSALQCFRKSRLLAPGEHESIELRFPITKLAVFRQSAHAFVLDAGYYDIRVGTSSRASYLAGSIRLTRSAVVQALEPLAWPGEPARRRPENVCFQYPEDREEIEQAHRHAIRFSDRALPRRSRKKGARFTGCRADGEQHTLLQVRTGECNVFQLVAGMDDASLKHLVEDFGTQQSTVPGALGTSAALERYGIAAVQLAEGAQGLHLQQQITDEQTGQIVRRQNATLFPAPSLLACSFDEDLVRAVGRAVGLEMAEFGVQLWLGPDSCVMRTPQAQGFAGQWSEDPIVCGRMSAALSRGVWPYGAFVLHTGDVAGEPALSQAALREVYALPFALAAESCHAAKLPQVSFGGQTLCQDGALVRAWQLDCGYSGMLWGGTQPPQGRVALEKSALRLIRLLLQLKNL